MVWAGESGLGDGEGGGRKGREVGDGVAVPWCQRDVLVPPKAWRDQALVESLRWGAMLSF